MDRTVPNVSKQVEVSVIIANNQMEWWERDGGVKFLKEIGLKSGQRVLDFGCRVGHYTIPAAEIVGNNGIVYAIDTQQHALKELRQKAEAHKLTNIRIIKTSGWTKLPLESGDVDVIFLYDVLHYLKKDDRTELYHEAFRLLRRDGFLSVYPKHILEDNPIMEFQNICLEKIKQEILYSGFLLDKRHCGFMSHDDSLTQGCVLNFRKEKLKYQSFMTTSQTIS